MSKQLNVRSDRDWQALCSEFNICKRRLKSKEDGLLILSKELDTIRGERNEYKLMAEQLREKYHGQKRKYEEREKALGLWSPDNDHVAERRSHSLAQLLSEARAQNRRLQQESDDLKQKLTESHGDIKLLRENIARQRVGDEGVGARHFPAHEREELVKQIEELREQNVSLDRELTAKIDDEEEILSEKEHYRQKAERLNQELNYILGGDEKRIVDIDALCMENQYLKERLKQCQEEKDLANQTLAKYKNALDRRRGKGTMKLGGNRTGGVVISQKQVQQLLAEGKGTGIPATPSSVADLQNLASALLDTVNDKNLALNHQRNTNKILGKRVAELEKKLKTLEVSGFWNLPTSQLKGKTLASVIAENEEMKAGIKALTPRLAATSDQESDDGMTPPTSSRDGTTPPTSSQASPSHEVKSQTTTTCSDTDSLMSLDLDLLSPQGDTSSVSDSVQNEKTEELSISNSIHSEKPEISKKITKVDLVELLDETNDTSTVCHDENNVDELIQVDDFPNDNNLGTNNVIGKQTESESETSIKENNIDVTPDVAACQSVTQGEFVDKNSIQDCIANQNIDPSNSDTREETSGADLISENTSPRLSDHISSGNLFDETQGPNPFDEEPGANPFDEEPGANPFYEEPGVNPFDEEPGANPFDEEESVNSSDEAQNSNPFLESTDMNENQETLNEVGELIEDIFDDVANKLAIQKTHKTSTESQNKDGEKSARPSSPLLNKQPPQPPPPPPPARDVEV
ncbi:uncharacterized protein LOC144446440 [Glandiceps talaboti]